MKKTLIASGICRMTLRILAVLCILTVLCCAYGMAPDRPDASAPVIYRESLPSADDFDGVNAYVIINDSMPFFTEEEKTSTEPFELYSDLDELGRCGVAYANLCTELMPTEERGEIGMVKPTGWHTVKYDCVDGKYLYNRCHLIGYQLAGENANEKNLITGTRYLNIDGMLGLENMVADYIQETGNHVLYRVTPVFDGDNLLCDGVLMEVWSVEDQGEDICVCIFAFNVQPGIQINYATGDSVLSADTDVTTPSANNTDGYDYVLNTNSMKFHMPDCTYAAKISADNRHDYHGYEQDLILMGYEPCGSCIK